MTITEYLSRESQPVSVSNRRPPSLDTALSLSWISVVGRVHEGILKPFISVLSRITSSVASIFDRSVCRTLSSSTAEETLGEFNSATQTMSGAEPFWPVTELFCPSTTRNLPTRRDEEATHSRSIIVEIPPASYAVASRQYRGLCRAPVVINCFCVSNSDNESLAWTTRSCIVLVSLRKMRSHFGQSFGPHN